MDPFIATLSAVIEEKLQKSMQEEIVLLRELLGNCLKEQTSLIHKDKDHWHQIMQDRFILLEQIKKIRTNRSSIDQPLDSASCDTLLLTEQLFALIQKIHEQSQSNESLLADPQQLIAITPLISYPRKESINFSKKNTLMTLP